MKKLFYPLAAVLLGLAAYLAITDGASVQMWSCVASGFMCIAIGTANRQK